MLRLSLLVVLVAAWTAASAQTAATPTDGPSLKPCTDLSCAFLDPALKPGSKPGGIDLKGYVKPDAGSRYETMSPTYNKGGGS